MPMLVLGFLPSDVHCEVGKMSIIKGGGGGGNPAAAVRQLKRVADGVVGTFALNEAPSDH